MYTSGAAGFLLPLQCLTKLWLSHPFHFVLLWYRKTLLQPLKAQGAAVPMSAPPCTNPLNPAHYTLFLHTSL